MKLNIIISPDKEEEIIIYTHEKTKLITDIENLINNNKISLTGHIDDEIIPIDINEVQCFFIQQNKLFCFVDNKKLHIKARLYEIENINNPNFIKINQSCIINIKYIKKFKASFNGQLMVILSNGYYDYISRRELKKVKERLGL